MRFHDAAIGAAVAGLCIFLVGCGTPDPNRYTGLVSSDRLEPNKNDTTGRIPYSYAEPTNWHDYDRIIVDPVAIYRGADNQFGDMSDDDKRTLADYMRFKFSEKLEARFALVNDVAPRTLRLKLTLTGAENNSAVVSTVVKFDLAGGLYNGVQAVRGREGMMTGSVIYAVELFDASSNRLLASYITKQYPGAMNIGATIGGLAAAKTGIQKGADALVHDLQ